MLVYHLELEAGAAVITVDWSSKCSILGFNGVLIRVFSHREYGYRMKCVGLRRNLALYSTR